MRFCIKSYLIVLLSVPFTAFSFPHVDFLNSFGTTPLHADSQTSSLKIPHGLTQSQQSEYMGKVFDQLEFGQLQYGYDTEMVRGESHQFKVFITQNLTAELKQELWKLQIAKLDTIRISTTMGVKIYGANFEVKPADPFEQIIDSNFTEWLFDIKPLVGGEQNLNLVVYAILDLPNHKEKRREVETSHKVINVKVRFYERITDYFDIRTTITTLISTSLIVFVSHKITKHLKGRKKRKP
jgi:hypothetical protein